MAKLSKYMNDLDGNLFKFTHDQITLSEYNRIKTKLKAKEEELEGSDEDGMVTALFVGKEHVLTYDEFEGLIYTNYTFPGLLRGKLLESIGFKEFFIDNLEK